MYPNIEAERARKGLTKEQLAAELEVDRKTLRKWLRIGNIPTAKIIQMADFFGCSVDYLLSTSNENKPAWLEVRKTPKQKNEKPLYPVLEAIAIQERFFPDMDFKELFKKW